MNLTETRRQWLERFAKGGWTREDCETRSGRGHKCPENQWLWFCENGLVTVSVGDVVLTKKGEEAIA